MVDHLRCATDAGRNDRHTGEDLYPLLRQRFFELEREKVFKQAWHVMGHVNDAPNTGDYLTLDILGERVVTVLQNIDALYWKVGGERRGRAALRVRQDVFCVFNATPLEKYESYRDYIEGWQDGRPHPATSRRSRRPRRRSAA